MAFARDLSVARQPRKLWREARSGDFLLMEVSNEFDYLVDVTAPGLLSQYIKH